MVGRLNAAQLRALNRAVLRIYEDVSIEQPLAAVVDALQELTPSTWLSADEVTGATGRMEHRIGRNLEAIADLPERMRLYGPTHPIVSYLKSGGQATALRISDLMTFRQLKRTPYFNELMGHMPKVRDQEVVICKIPTGMLGFTLNRERMFKEEERLMAELLQPHIERVIARSIQYGQLPAAGSLTPRECEVLHWMAEGKRDNEISGILRIGTRTVEQHVRAILRKMNVETRANAIADVWRMRLGNEANSAEGYPKSPASGSGVNPK